MKSYSPTVERCFRQCKDPFVALLAIEGEYATSTPFATELFCSVLSSWPERLTRKYGNVGTHFCLPKELLPIIRRMLGL